MGNEASSSSTSLNDSRGFLREFKASFDFHSEVNDRRFGDIVLYKHRTDKKFIAKRGILCSSSDDLQAYARICRQRLTNIHSTSILQLLHFQEASQENVCGNFNTITVYFEYFFHDLEKELVRRREGQEYFTEPEIWYLMDSLVTACSELEKAKIYHGDLRPSNILLTSEGLVKIADKTIVRGDQSSYFKTLSGKENCYLSQYLMRSLATGEINPTFDIQKTDVFSLGMTLLEVTTLSPPAYAYDFAKPELVVSSLDTLLDCCRQRYSDFLTNVLKEMLAENESQRPSFEDLLAVLSPLSVPTISQSQYHIQSIELGTPLVYSRENAAQQQSIFGDTSEQIAQSPSLPTPHQQSPIVSDKNNFLSNSQADQLKNSVIIQQQQQPSKPQNNSLTPTSTPSLMPPKQNVYHTQIQGNYQAPQKQQQQQQQLQQQQQFKQQQQYQKEQQYQQELQYQKQQQHLQQQQQQQQLHQQQQQLYQQQQLQQQQQQYLWQQQQQQHQQQQQQHQQYQQHQQQQQQQQQTQLDSHRMVTPQHTVDPQFNLEKLSVNNPEVIKTFTNITRNSSNQLMSEQAELPRMIPVVQFKLKSLASQQNQLEFISEKTTKQSQEIQQAQTSQRNIPQNHNFLQQVDVSLPLSSRQVQTPLQFQSHIHVNSQVQQESQTEIPLLPFEQSENEAKFVLQQPIQKLYKHSEEVPLQQGQHLTQLTQKPQFDQTFLHEIEHVYNSQPPQDRSQLLTQSHQISQPITTQPQESGADLNTSEIFRRVDNALIVSQQLFDRRRQEYGYVLPYSPQPPTSRSQQRSIHYSPSKSKPQITESAFQLTSKTPIQPSTIVTPTIPSSQVSQAPLPHVQYTRNTSSVKQPILMSSSHILSIKQPLDFSQLMLSSQPNIIASPKTQSTPQTTETLQTSENNPSQINSQVPPPLI